MVTGAPTSKLAEQTELSATEGGGSRDSLSSTDVSLLDILIILADAKRPIFLITLAFTVIALVLSFVLPSRYTASVTLLPPQQTSSMGAALASQMGSMGGMAALAGAGFGLKNPNDMYVAMLKSRSVEDAIVQRFGLMGEYRKKRLSDARKTLEENTTINGAGKDNLIHISVIDRNPSRAAQLANGYVEEFRTLSEHLAIGEASQRRLFFEGQLERTKNSLADAEEALKRTEQQTGMIQLDSQARALIQSAASLRAQIAAKEVQIGAMQTYATGQNAQLVQAQQELAGLRAQLAKLGGSEDSAGSLILPKGNVSAAGLEYVRKLREVKYQEAIFNILARQFEMAKLDEAKEGALIQVVDPAIPPDRRSSPKRTLIVLGGWALGFVFAVAFALMKAAYNHLSADPETNAKIVFLRRSLSLRLVRS